MWLSLSVMIMLIVQFFHTIPEDKQCLILNTITTETQNCVLTIKKN